MPKRPLSVILLVALFVQLSGTGLVYALQRRALYASQVDRIAAGRFDHKEKVLLAVQPDGIRWVKPHEFVYQGYMYDVVTMAEVNGTLQIAALKDDREDKVREAFDERQETTPVSPAAAPLKVVQLYYAAPQMPALAIESVGRLPVAFRKDQRIYSSPYPIVFSPPPEA